MRGGRAGAGLAPPAARSTVHMGELLFVIDTLQLTSHDQYWSRSISSG